MWGGAATKATQLGEGHFFSGPDGYIYGPDGISGKKIDYMFWNSVHRAMIS